MFVQPSCVLCVPEGWRCRATALALRQTLGAPAKLEQAGETVCTYFGVCVCVCVCVFLLAFLFVFVLFCFVLFCFVLFCLFVCVCAVIPLHENAKCTSHDFGMQAGKWKDELRYLDLRTDYQRKAATPSCSVLCWM